jgi:hypothetical protein
MKTIVDDHTPIGTVVRCFRPGYYKIVSPDAIRPGMVVLRKVLTSGFRPAGGIRTMPYTSCMILTRQDMIAEKKREMDTVSDGYDRLLAIL